MFGATQEQQDDAARAAEAVGGYWELVEQMRAPPTTETAGQAEVVTYTIDPRTRQVRPAPR